MALYKDPKSDFWYIDLYDENGKRYRKSTGTKNKRKASNMHAELEHGFRMAKMGIAPRHTIEPEPEDIPQVSLSEFSTKYNDYMVAKFQPKTAEACRSAFSSLKKFTSPEDPYLTDVTVGQVEEWQVWVLSTSKPATLDIHFRTLRAAWNRAIRWGDATANPFSGAESPKVDTDEDDENVRFFEQHELDALYKITSKDPYWHRMVKFYLYSGMRRQELTHLEWSDIDLQTNEIRIAGRKTVHLPELSYALGRRKYTLPAREYSFRTKNGKRRVIPVNEHFRALIDELRKRQSDIIGLDKCPLVFPAVRTACQNRVWNKDKITRKFKNCVSEAGLPDSLTLHSLRHTFASRLVQSGKSLFQVGELLGHSDLEVTKVYAHLTPQSLAPVVSDLNFE